MVARKPVFDRRKSVFAYHFVTPSPDASTTALVRLGVERMAPNKTVVADHDVQAEAPQFGDLPRDRFIVNVRAEDADSALEYADNAMSDDVRVAVPHALFEKHVEDAAGRVRYMVIDPNGSYDVVLANKIATVRKHGIRVIAENVDDYATFNKCSAMGVEYFAGAFITRPLVVGRRSIASSRLVLLQLLARLQDPDVSLDEIERLISSDPHLGFRLLRLVNSAAEGRREPVESIRSAVLLAGTAKIANLISLLTFQKMDDKPNALTIVGLLRGRTCETLARNLGYDRPERFFTAGALSILDAMFDVSMDEIIEQLPLTTEMSQALLDPNTPDNPVARVLGNVLALESAHFDEIDASIGDSLRDAYLESIQWADETSVVE